jgi:hypothetical protein
MITSRTRTGSSLAVGSPTSFVAGCADKPNQDEQSIIMMMNSNDIHEYNKNSSTNRRVVNGMDCKENGCFVQTKVIHENRMLARYQQGQHNHAVPGPVCSISASSVASAMGSFPASRDSLSDKKRKSTEQNSSLAPKKAKNNEFPTNVALAKALCVHADKKLPYNPHSHDKQFHYYIYASLWVCKSHSPGGSQEVHSKNMQMLKVS